MSQVPDEVLACLEDLGLRVKEGNVVIIHENAPAHPRNWSFSRKVYDTGVLTAFITIS